LSHAFYGVVFDYDGVLLPESEEINIGAGVKTFNELGLPLTVEEIASIPGHSSRVYIPPLLRARGIGLELDEEIVAQNKANYDKIWPGKATLASGLIEVLTHFIGNDLPLAVVTSNRRAIIDRFLQTMLPIKNPFRVIVAGGDVTHHKPHPGAYLLAAERLGISPDFLLAVEDTAVGVASVKAAGLRCAAIPNRFSKDQDFSEADYNINSLYELITITGGERS
jgi:HAD superfamily hydrolase (TIGR01509 family)